MLVKKLQYSYEKGDGVCSLPFSLQDSLQIISHFFEKKTSNKLCLIFPTKEFAAQWISFVLALQLLEEDYKENKSEIFKAYEKYQPGQKLILNNKAVVEWVSGNETEARFRTKGKVVKTRPWENTQGDIVTIKASKIATLRPAPETKKVLSARESVYNSFSLPSLTPLDKLLSIDSCNNLIFQKQSIALVSKFTDYEKSHCDVLVNDYLSEEYIQARKIDDNGVLNTGGPLLLTNNLSSLSLYTMQNSLSSIIIDGSTFIRERRTDFSDIDGRGIPTILITDLSELENFELLNTLRFDFFHFTKDNLRLSEQSVGKPFHTFLEKQNNYIENSITKVVCENDELEIIVKKIHSIREDESNHDLNTLKFQLVQFVNILSGISHFPEPSEILDFNQKIGFLDALFLRNKMWLGESHQRIEESISLLKSIVTNLGTLPLDKFSKLKALVSQSIYEYVICSTNEESKSIKKWLTRKLPHVKVITAAEVKEIVQTDQIRRAIVTCWLKGANINKVIFSFQFSELTFLFYQFEERYYQSLQARNKRHIKAAEPSINKDGFLLTKELSEIGFGEIFSANYIGELVTDSQFDIVELELSLDDIRYSRFQGAGDFEDIISAKRIDFDDDYGFYYASKSHKLLIINELVDKTRKRGRHFRKTVESLQKGDVIAIINTDRDILAELVEKNVNPGEWEEIKKWTDLWKNLLRQYYLSIGSDFKQLVENLREHDCKKHEATIRTWIADENMIGPDDDSDLVSISLLTNSNFLNDNIGVVRKAISKMTGWRMAAADAVVRKIRSKIHEFAHRPIINTSIAIQDLGSLTVLRVAEVSDNWEKIEARFVNRFLQRDIF